MPGYTKMPVDQAAQDVQHSADGSAYEQWAEVATLLAGYFTGSLAGRRVLLVHPGRARPNLTGALRQLTETFGPRGKDGVLVGVTTDRSGQKRRDGAAVVHVQRDAAWTVASWLVAHAQQYGISQSPVRRLCVECRQWQHGLAAGRHPAGRRSRARQYCRGLRRHRAGRQPPYCVSSRD